MHPYSPPSALQGMKNAEAPDVNRVDGAASTLPATAGEDLPAQIRPPSSLLDVPPACNTSHSQTYLLGPQNATAVISCFTASLPLQPDLLHSLLSQRPSPVRARRLPWVEPTLIKWYPVLASPGRPRAAHLEHLLRTEGDGRRLPHSAGGPGAGGSQATAEPEPRKTPGRWR